MNKLLARTLIAAAFGGAVLSSTPTSAANFSINIGIRGTSFSYESGGYCDRWGCPDEFWDYPIYYCPVYYRGRWYTGPVYYRHSRSGYLYWIHGGWRRDMWYRARPRGACVDRYGPPLDLDFYIWSGFNVRDEWRYNWRNQRNDWWHRRQDWDRSNRNDTSWQSWVPMQQRNYDWDRERSWNTDRDWTRPDWNRRDWELRNRTDRGAPPTSPTNGFRNNSPTTNRDGTIVAPSQMSPALVPPANNNLPADTSRDRHRNGPNSQGTGSSTGGTVTAPTQGAPTIVPPVSNVTPIDSGGHDGRRHGQDNQGAIAGSGSGTIAPTQNTPAIALPATPTTPTNSGGRGRRKGGQDSQGAGASNGVPATPAQTTPAVTAPITDTPPADKKAKHHKHDSNNDDKEADPNGQK